MFDENFSFASPPSPSLESSTTATTRTSSRSVSPCTTSAPFPSPRFSVTDLAAQFAEQRIQRTAQICYDSCEAYANNDDDAAWSVPAIDDSEHHSLRRSQTFPQRSYSPSRREQRQANARLLYSASHHRDIAALVKRMVDSQDQCCISPADLLTPEPDEDEDEGYNSSDDATTEASRRSSTSTEQSRHEYRRVTNLMNGGACVNKSIRLRRKNRRTLGRNTERSS